MSRFLSAFSHRVNTWQFSPASSSSFLKTTKGHASRQITRNTAGRSRDGKRHSSTQSIPPRPQQRSELALYTGTLLVLGGSFYLTYKFNEPFRHGCLAAVRCSRVAGKLHILRLKSVAGLTFYHRIRDTWYVMSCKSCIVVLTYSLNRCD